MPNIPQVKIGNNIYNVKDAEARNMLAGISQMSRVPDEVRAKNIFEGTQYDTLTRYTYTVTKEEYSGIHITGSIPYKTSAVWLSQGVMDFTAGSPYTMYIVPKSHAFHKDNIVFSIHGIQASGHNVQVNPGIEKPLVFTPDLSVTNTFVEAWQDSPEYETGMPIDETFYIYIVEGAYEKNDFDALSDTIDKTDIVWSNLTQMAGVSDEVRSKNIFEGIQYDNLIRSTYTVTKEEYSGIHITGSIPYRTSYLWVSENGLILKAGKQYTMYIESKNHTFKQDNCVIAIANVTDNGNNVQVNPGLELPIVFSPDSDSVPGNTYLNIWQDNPNYESGMPIDETFYIYIVEGAYGKNDFTSRNTNAQGIDVLDYAETQVTSNLTVGLPILYLYGDVREMTKDNSVVLSWFYKNSNGSCTAKWQGASSVSYSKKNYSIKFDNAIDVGWGSQKKYVLKANYIDSTSALNLCAAKIWSQIVSDRGSHPAISVAANNGAMDGFPVIVMLNGEFHGLYTFNTPKDPWTFGMGSGSNEYLVTAEQHYPATQFKALTDLEGVDFELEYAPDGVEANTVKTSMNTMIQSIINADGSNWENSVSTYMDIDTAIDYMIFSALIGNTDGVDKNFILSSYSGTKWYFNAYDLDSIFGNAWFGGAYESSKQSSTSFAGMAATSRLFYLIYTYSKDKLIARYNVLRNGILSEDNIAHVFYNFCGRIPDPIINADNEKWPLKPGTYTETLSRIIEWYRLRLNFIDNEVSQLNN